MSNKLTRMARQILAIEADAPYRFDYTDGKVSIDDFDLYVFEQVWGSTALGFSGVGGQAFTSENTYVLVPSSCKQKCFVYFGSKFAYSVDYSHEFMDDVLNQKVAPVYGKSKYPSQERSK